MDRILQLGGGRSIVLGLQREDGSGHVKLFGACDRAVMKKEECSRRLAFPTLGVWTGKHEDE